jgi:Holliday junction resolvasome RuvABC endonuclease subunit
VETYIVDSTPLCRDHGDTMTSRERDGNVKGLHWHCLMKLGSWQCTYRAEIREIVVGRSAREYMTRKDTTMHVMGIDPGLQHTGYAVLRVQPDAASPACTITLQDAGVITPSGTGALVRRLSVLRRARELVLMCLPAVIVLEDYHWQGAGRRAGNAAQLQRMVGMLETLALTTWTCGATSSGVEQLVLLEPGAWMRQLCGPGPTPKTHVAAVVQRRLGTAIPEPRGRRHGNHATDAAGVALAWLDQWLLERLET